MTKQNEIDNLNNRKSMWRKMIGRHEQHKLRRKTIRKLNKCCVCVWILLTCVCFRCARSSLSTAIVCECNPKPEWRGFFYFIFHFYFLTSSLLLISQREISVFLDSLTSSILLRIWGVRHFVFDCWSPKGNARLVFFFTTGTWCASALVLTDYTVLTNSNEAQIAKVVNKKKSLTSPQK